VSPCGGCSTAGAEGAGVLGAAVAALGASLTEALAVVLDASPPAGAVDVEAPKTWGTVVVSVVRGRDDDASTWAEARRISKMLTNARAKRARAPIPATAIMFDFINKCLANNANKGLLIKINRAKDFMESHDE
jgi:hypothetical protein